MLSVLLIVVAAGLVVASVLTDSLVLAVAGLVVAVIALGLLVWPVLMARRAAAVAAEEAEEAEDAGETEDAEDGARPVATPAPERVTAPEATAGPEPTPDPEPAAAVEPADEEPAADDSRVLVVPGRHRFHRAGCGMLDGREPDVLDLEEAREEGFTPCSRCAAETAAPRP